MVEGTGLCVDSLRLQGSRQDIEVGLRSRDFFIRLRELLKLMKRRDGIDTKLSSAAEEERVRFKEKKLIYSWTVKAGIGACLKS